MVRPVAIVGRGVMYASVLALLVAVTMLLLLHWAVIVKEEAYLEREPSAGPNPRTCLSQDGLEVNPGPAAGE